MVSDTHYVISQQRLFILHFLQKGLERISCIENSQRSAVLIHDWNIFQPALLHS